MKKIERNKSFGLDEEDLKNVVEIFAANEKVNQLILFGSRAIGNYENGSDIDLALKGFNINFDDLMSLKSTIEELNLPYNIDLIDCNSISNEKLKHHINRVGKLLYEKS